MATQLPLTDRSNGDGTDSSKPSLAIKAGLARMLKGGVIMDVTNAEQVSILHFPYFDRINPLIKVI